jgi:hypothetical protein
MALISPNIFNKNDSYKIKNIKCYIAALYILAELVFYWTMATDLLKNEYLLYIPLII